MKQQVRARLVDVLLSDVILPPQPDTATVLSREEIFQHNMAIRQILGGATCIEASNVARFFDDNYMIDEAGGEALWKDLKCLVPPHPKFFIEWDRPRIPNTKRMGTLFVTCAPDEAAGIARAIIGNGAQATPERIAKFRADPRCRWIYLTLDFMEFAPSTEAMISNLRGPYHIGTISVAEDGELLDFWMSHATRAISEQESLQVMAASLVGWTTLSMLNCANITTAEHHAPPAFQKARKSSGKKPLVSYHTIHVDLDKTPSTIGAETLPGEAGTTRRHKKRGHIKDYRGGKGLFGRYKGLWYWGLTLAGSEDRGVIVSDYEVRP